MKKQINLTQKRLQKTLTLLLISLFSLPLFAQNPGRGHGHHGGGHGGGNSDCNAHFNVHRDSVLNGVIFSNHDGSSAATYAWDFGDGTTSTSSDPSHVFPDTGYYYVCLTVTDTVGGGCTGTHCDSIYVSNPAPRCNANFRAKADSIANGVKFSTSRRSNSSSGSNTTYAWDFGDGTTSTLANPTHTYAVAGKYYVCLTITKTTPGGTCTDTHCDSVNTDFPHHGGPHHNHRLANPNGVSATANLYPNPMVESTTVRLENTTGNATIRIFEMTGKVVFTKSIGNGDNVISKENISEGLYFYTIEDGNMVVSTGKLRVY
jgi:PKD repeat protein